MPHEVFVPAVDPASARSAPLGAADLLRSVGLMADGPVTWGRPVPSGRPGVYVVEWPEARATAPIELTTIGKWIERRQDLRLDGRRPTSREVAARLHDFWLPGQVVLFIGMATGSIGGRVRALVQTPLGDRRPYPGGQWLRTLTGLERTRVWWAASDAPEEYEDALFTAFAAAVDASPDAAPRLPDRSLVLPFANLQDATGRRRTHGLSGTIEPKPPAVPAPGTTIRELPGGSADGAEESAVGRPLERRAPSAPRPMPADRPAGTGSRRAASVDVATLNDTLQRIACRSLLRELAVADAAAELVAAGFFRGTKAQPVAVLRDLLKQGLVEGAHQDPDRRWSIRCARG
ncbi:MAG: hypothetical protein IVW53_07850 [Chloroflexi bacterium]|nr:hypothetical protein [Chloroflexota bacterium]